MSLTQKIKDPIYGPRLDAIIPRQSASLGVPRLVDSRTRVPALIGTAFDYAARIELARHCTHAVQGPWVAEMATGLLEKRLPGLSYLPALTKAVADARSWADTYARRGTGAARDPATVAEHALRLARIDVVYRAGYLAPELLADPAAAEISEMIELLARLPIERLAHDSRVLLNPTFGWCSAAVGGADADIITGDRLIDFKTTSSGRVERDMLRQLVGYYLLARAAAEDGLDVPPIASLEIYFARFGHFRVIDTTELLAHPDFNSTERWFREEVMQIGGRFARLVRADWLRRTQRQPQAATRGPKKARGRAVDERPRARAVTSGVSRSRRRR